MLPRDWFEIFINATAIDHKANDHDSRDTTSELLEAVKGTSFEALFAEAA